MRMNLSGCWKLNTQSWNKTSDCEEEKQKKKEAGVIVFPLTGPESKQAQSLAWFLLNQWGSFASSMWVTVVNVCCQEAPWSNRGCAAPDMSSVRPENNSLQLRFLWENHKKYG